MAVLAPASRPAKKRRTYRKNQTLFALIGKMKLWPSRKGILHGIREMTINGNLATITTHCGHTFPIRDSRTSRAGRWLRNKNNIIPCKACSVPEWKIEKYKSTSFKKTHGASLATPKLPGEISSKVFI